jgi:hypothetical protein
VSDARDDLVRSARGTQLPPLGHFVSRRDLEMLQLMIEKGLLPEALAVVRSILGRRPRFPISSEVDPQ